MKTVIIGAGQTGRGFIAPKFYNNNFEITFIDKDKKLIRELKIMKEYKVKYFNQEYIDIIKDYSSYHLEDETCIHKIAEADIVTTSVFSGNIKDLIPLFKKAINIRTKKEKLIIICIENGIDVKQVLMNEGFDAYISEGLIFCTSLRGENSLDITSEYDVELPIDGSSLPEELEIQGMPKTNEFSRLIQRKIYTYNYISAIIAYMGFYKGYTKYAEAANNPEIASMIRKVLPGLNSLIAKEYEVGHEEQRKFSMRAVDKFENYKIVDTISRNAQQVERKLGETERLLKPLILALKYDEGYKDYLEIISYGIYYGVCKEGMNAHDTIMSIGNTLNINSDDEILVGISKFTENLFENNDSI